MAAERAAELGNARRVPRRKADTPPERVSTSVGDGCYNPGRVGGVAMAAPAVHWNGMPAPLPMPRKEPQGEAAIRGLTERGFRLFPVAARGKRPLIAEWPERATCDVEALEAWTLQFPGCNWGWRAALTLACSFLTWMATMARHRSVDSSKIMDTNGQTRSTRKQHGDLTSTSAIPLTQ